MPGPQPSTVPKSDPTLQKALACLVPIAEQYATGKISEPDGLADVRNQALKDNGIEPRATSRKPKAKAKDTEPSLQQKRPAAAVEQNHPGSPMETAEESPAVPAKSTPMKTASPKAMKKGSPKPKAKSQAPKKGEKASCGNEAVAKGFMFMFRNISM